MSGSRLNIAASELSAAEQMARMLLKQTNPIRLRRVTRGWTQKKLSQKCGWSSWRHLRALEATKGTRVGYTTITRISKALKVETWRLAAELYAWWGMCEDLSVENAQRIVNDLMALLVDWELNDGDLGAGARGETEDNRGE